MDAPYGRGPPRPKEKTPLKHWEKRMVNQWQKKTGIARENMPVMGPEYP
jgi:hypothetical protein